MQLTPSLMPKTRRAFLAKVKFVEGRAINSFYKVEASFRFPRLTRAASVRRKTKISSKKGRKKREKTLSIDVSAGEKSIVSPLG